MGIKLCSHHLDRYQKGGGIQNKKELFVSDGHDDLLVLWLTPSELLLSHKLVDARKPTCREVKRPEGSKKQCPAQPMLTKGFFLAKLSAPTSHNPNR